MVTKLVSKIYKKYTTNPVQTNWFLTSFCFWTHSFRISHIICFQADPFFELSPKTVSSFTGKFIFKAHFTQSKELNNYNMKTLWSFTWLLIMFSIRLFCQNRHQNAVITLIEVATSSNIVRVRPSKTISREKCKTLTNTNFWKNKL